MAEVFYKIQILNKHTKQTIINDVLDIYLHSVDEGSETNTNQINYYIRNMPHDKRQMFFYALFVNDEIIGYAEYAFLPRNQVLLIDYLCLRQRNHIYFFNFYQLILEDIIKKLQNKNMFIKYVVTELSLRTINGKLIDIDSNFFRKLLSIENFKIIRTPYYQPGFENQLLESSEFNLAIKSLLSSPNIYFDNNKILCIIKEIYFEHYGKWYEKFMDPEIVLSHLNRLYSKIEEEIPHNILPKKIDSVNCKVFDEGKCNLVTFESITISKKRKRKFIDIISYGALLTFSFLTFFFCFYYPVNSRIGNLITQICSTLTITTVFFQLIHFVKQSLRHR